MNGRFNNTLRGERRLVSLFALAVAVAAAQVPTVSMVVNAAYWNEGSTDNKLCPGVDALVFGQNLGNGQASSVTVTIAGEQGAVLQVTGSTFLWVQFPWDAPLGPAALTVTAQGSTSAPFAVTLESYAPAMYESAISGGIFYSSLGQAVTSANPAHASDLISVYAVGLGPTEPPIALGAAATMAAPTVTPVTVSVGGQSVIPLYAGAASGVSGLYEVIFQVPSDIGVGDQQVAIEIGGEVSPSETLSMATGPPTISSVSDAATGSKTIASGAWISIYGTHLSTISRPWASTDFVGSGLPLSLEGVSVKVDDLPAAISYVSPAQVNVLAPLDTTLGAVQVQLTNSFGTDSAGTTLALYSPGFFLFSPDNYRYVAAVHTDGVYVGPSGLFQGAVTRPAQPGETILIFGNGFGPTSPPVPADQLLAAPAPLADPSLLTISIGGVPAQVTFAGLGAVGEYQFNLVVPGLADGDQSIAANIAGVQTQSGVFLTVQK